MSLLACGINHHTAPLAIREKAVFTPDSMPEPLLDMVRHTHAQEAVIISTCNRTEFYCTDANPIAIADWLHKRQQLPAETLGPYLYVHRDEAAVRHLLRVASGLDSMVLGEPQILGQIKRAFSFAQTAGTLGAHLHRLFEYVFSATKQVRTQTAIGDNPVSLAFAAVDLAKHIFTDLSKMGVLLVGAGETMELMARHLRTAGVSSFWVANRTLARAKKVAAQVGGEGIALAAIADYLTRADMVVTATASPLPIIGKGMIERALKARKRRPIFMVDLAVPRNIEPETSNLEDIYLYTLDDLHTVIQQNLQQRQQAATEAEAIIDKQAAHYVNNLKILAVIPFIKAYRDKAADVRDAELTKALNLIKAGMAPDEVLKRLAHNLTNKLLHAPSVQLRQAAYHEQKEVLTMLCQILELKNYPGG